jgi:hypothetical protein
MREHADRRQAEQHQRIGARLGDRVDDDAVVAAADRQDRARLDASRGWLH